jgi:uncharacterized protein YbaP (TraB family)
MSKSKKLKKNTLLWKIINRNTLVESYVYGTVHLRDESVYFLLDKLKELIAKSDVFIAEYNLDDAGDPEIMNMLQLPNNKHIRELVPEKKYEKLHKQILKSFGMDLDRFGYFKPMVIENMLTEIMFDTDYDFPMDVILWNYAKELGKDINGAESTDGQIEIMRKLSVDQQMKSLIAIGRNPAKFKKKIMRIVSYYKEQNLRELHKKSLKSLGKLKKILVYDRNIRIVNTIDDFAKNKKVFAAIGAGHLYGEKGILRLLKHKGYKVKPVN